MRDVKDYLLYQTSVSNLFNFSNFFNSKQVLKSSVQQPHHLGAAQQKATQTIVVKVWLFVPCHRLRVFRFLTRSLHISQKTIVVQTSLPKYDR